MARKGKYIPFDLRQLIIFNYYKGLEYREISKVFQISKCTIGDIIKRFKKEDRIESIKQKGCPPKLFNCDKGIYFKPGKKKNKNK